MLKHLKIHLKVLFFLKHKKTMRLSELFGIAALGVVLIFALVSCPIEELSSFSLPDY